jgi:lysophospholipase L1-like esterase
MRTALVLADRTAVLFLGIAAGAAIGYAFGSAGIAPPPAGLTVPAGNARAAAAVLPPSAGPGGLEYGRPFQPHLLRAVAAGEPVTIGVFGDSFGDGVFTALYRLLPRKDRFRVLKFSQQSTGFTRYGRLNLQEHADRQIAEDGPVDVAVISFGANDTQGVYAEGHAAPLMSPEWQRIVGARVDGFVGLMRARGVAVYWLGLPKMRAAAFDADIAAMNDFYRRRMAALRVPFIDVHPLTVDPRGDYAAYLPDPVNGKEPRLLRANDGIHMSMNGYIVITRALAQRIRRYVAAAERIALPAARSGSAAAASPVVVAPPGSPQPAIRRADVKWPAPKPRRELRPEPEAKRVSRSVEQPPAEAGSRPRAVPIPGPAAPHVEAPSVPANPAPKTPPAEPEAGIVTPRIGDPK